MKSLARRVAVLESAQRKLPEGLGFSGKSDEELWEIMQRHDEETAAIPYAVFDGWPADEQIAFLRQKTGR